jgi:hypothetical protein
VPAHDALLEHDRCAAHLAQPRHHLERACERRASSSTQKNRAEVDAFHAAALSAGGTDNGAPAFPDFAKNFPPGYYAAFVLDPGGNNMEAVFRER